ncbi:MAG TPA: hypothetical protein VK421_18595 [Pyrinomonadaceae bacterium]|nr:hypothetical protein [Pyrinomonadaceae bacterium]
MRTLLEMLLPPDEEMDEVSSSVILEEMGVDTRTLADDLRVRVEREIQKLQAKGEDVPETLYKVAAVLVS